MSGHTPMPRRAAPDSQDSLATVTMSPAAANRLEALRALRPGQVILAVGVAVIVTTVLVVSIGRLAGFTKLGDTLSGATWGWLGLCALGQMGVFVGYAGAFRASVAGSGDLIGEPANIASDDTDSDHIADNIAYNDTDGKPEGDTDTGTGADSNPEGDTDTDSNPEGDTDTGTGTDGDPEGDTGTGTDGDPEGDTDTGTGADSNPSASTGADGDPGSDFASRRGPRVGVSYSLKVALAGFALTQLVAAGGAAGMAFTFWVMHRLGFSKKNAMVQLITLNTAVYFVFGGLGWVGALVGLVDPAVPKAMAVGWLAGFAAVIALALWFTQPQRKATFGAGEDAPRLRRALAVGISAAARVRDCTHTSDGRRLLAWSLLYWVGDLVSLWAALQAFGVTVSATAIVGAYVTGYLAQSVPIPLIATGGVDAATTFTLAAVGVPIEVALLGVVAHRVFAFWLPMIPGLWSATSLVRDERPAKHDSAKR